MKTPATRVTLTEVPEQLVASAVGIPAVSLPGADLPALSPVSAEGAGAVGAGSTDSSAVLSSPDTTTQWVAATARTWVNVRANAGRGGNVVGVIKPSEKAMLGSVGRGGFRQVKSPEMSGWADPRLFVADTVRTRGL